MGLADLIPSDWKKLLKDELKKEYFLKLDEIITKDYQANEVYPKYNEIFKSLEITPIKNVKAVIIGQDPYPTPGDAHGLSFSVPKTTKIPRSLNNIFKELVNDLKIENPIHGNLESWASEGVLLLNSYLTFNKNNPKAHTKIGWDKFTDKIINLVDKECSGVTFILWGSPAHKKANLITNKNNQVIMTSHPSPLSARHSFWNSRPFSRTNEHLKKYKRKEINWEIN